jgi:hypothetical protein
MLKDYCKKKNRKVADEVQIFKEQLIKDYFTYYNGKPVCLICKESLPVLKEYNLKRHYEKKTQRSVRMFYWSAKKL